MPPNDTQSEPTDVTDRSGAGSPRNTGRRAPADWILRYGPALLALTVGLISLHTARQSAIGPYGLIQALPIGYFGSLALLLLAFLLTWSSTTVKWDEFFVEVVVLVVLLQGAPALVESDPHFPTAWLIAGFTNYVARTGHALPGLDGRFNWPAFFEGAGLLQRAAGLKSSIDVIRWWPVVLNVLYLAPIGLISHRVLRDAKQTMLVLWLWPLSNWVGQDYFSPQSLAFLLYLTLIAIVIGTFGRQRRRLLPWVRSGESPEREELSPLGWSTVAMLLGALMVLDLAMVTSHPLTPVFAAITVVLLSAFGRTRLKAFAGVMFILTAGWTCYGAYDFWSGHIYALFGTAGNLTGNVSGDLINRVTGSVAHARVAAVRVVQSGLTAVAALAGWLQARKSLADVRTATILALSPVVVLPFQSYGGEAGLRIYLFALPGGLCLVVLLLGMGRRLRRVLTVGLTTVLLVPLFLLSAWGNELFDSVRPAEISGITALDKLAAPGSAVMSINGQLASPLRAADLLKYHYLSDFVYEQPRRDVKSMIATLYHYPRGAYVIFTTGQALFAEQNYDVPSSWNAVTEELMVKSGHFRLVFANSASRIYKFVASAA